MNDFLIAGNTGEIKGEISARFNRKDLGTPTHYIELQISQYEDQATIKLQGYLYRGLENTGMAEWRAVSRQMDAKNRLLACGPDEEPAPGGIT